jgi:hypothetical protein
MQDAEIMDMAQSQSKLREDSHGLPLMVPPVTSTGLASARDGSGEIAAICVFHDDAKVVVGQESIVVAYNVGML